MVVSAVGRGLRFFLVAGVFWLIGPSAEPFIDRHFNKICVLFAILLVGGVLAIHYLG